MLKKNGLSLLWPGVLVSLLALAPACQDSSQGPDPQDAGPDGQDASGDIGGDDGGPIDAGDAGADENAGGDGCQSGRTLVVVWESPNDLQNTIGIDFDIHQARSPDEGANWCGFGPLNSSAFDDEHQDEYPEMASDGQGGHLVVWHSLDTLGGTVDTDADIFYSRSADGGETWSDVGLVNTNATSDNNVDRFPDVATDGNGTYLTVWSSNLDLDASGSDYDILYSRSLDGGATWSDPALLNTNAGDDSQDDNLPLIYTDGSGTWIAVWGSTEDLDGVGTDPDIFFSRSADDGQTWSDPAVLNSNAADDYWGDTYCQLATNGQGTWVAIWNSRHPFEDGGDDKDVAFARSTDNGVTWSEAGLLNSNATTDVHPDNASHVVTDKAGNWIVVWTAAIEEAGTGRDTDIFFSRSTDDGITWGDLAPLNTNATTDSGSDIWPRLVAQGAGEFAVVWTTNEDTWGADDDADVVLARSTDGGQTWSDLVLVSPNATNDLYDDEHPCIGW